MVIYRVAVFSCLCVLLAACGSGRGPAATRFPVPTPTNSGERLGVITQGDMDLHFLGIEVPDGWETGVGANARYAIEFAVATVEIETCDYTLTGALAGQRVEIIRERHDVTVTIIDLAANQERATRLFEGRVPESCPEELDLQRIGERFTGYADAAEFRAWLTSELGDADGLPSVSPSLLAHRGTIESLVYDASGTSLVTGTEFGEVTLWNTESGKKLWSISNEINDHPVFNTTGDRLLTNSTNGMCKQWDINSGNELLTFNCQGGSASSSFSHDSSWILTPDRSGTVRIWDLETRTELLQLTGFEFGVSDAEFSPDSSRIAAIESFSKKVLVWNAQTGEQIAAFDVPYGSDIIDFNPDGTRLLVAGGIDNVIVVDASSGNRVTSLAGSIGFIHDAVFSSDGLYIATAGSDKRVRVWETQTGAELLRLMGHETGVTSVAFRPDGLRVAAGSEDGNVLIWDVSDLYAES